MAVRINSLVSAVDLRPAQPSHLKPNQLSKSSLPKPKVDHDSVKIPDHWPSVSITTRRLTNLRLFPGVSEPNVLGEV